MPFLYITSPLPSLQSSKQFLQFLHTGKTCKVRKHGRKESIQRLGKWPPLSNTQIPWLARRHVTLTDVRIRYSSRFYAGATKVTARTKVSVVQATICLRGRRNKTFENDTSAFQRQWELFARERVNVHLVEHVHRRACCWPTWKYNFRSEKLSGICLYYS